MNSFNPLEPVGLSSGAVFVAFGNHHLSIGILKGEAVAEDGRAVYEFYRYWSPFYTAEGVPRPELEVEDVTEMLEKFDSRRYVMLGNPATPRNLFLFTSWLQDLQRTDFVGNNAWMRALRRRLAALPGVQLGY